MYFIEIYLMTSSVEDLKFITEYIESKDSIIDVSSIEEQKKIEHKIHKKIVKKNWSDAYDLIPEIFVRQHQLTILVKINDLEIPALIDTGAVSTVMTKRLVDKCNLNNLVDDEMEENLIGISSVNSLGKIWYYTFNIDKFVIETSLIILNDESIDPIFEHHIIIGLDILKKYNAQIDFYNNAVTFNDMFTIKFIDNFKSYNLKLFPDYKLNSFIK